LRFFYGAERFMWNRCKEVADKADREAIEARVAELVSEHDDGMCHHHGCGRHVDIFTAPFESKKRWYCETHVDKVTFGARSRILGRCKGYEVALEKSSGVCMSEGCKNPLMEDTLRCERHQGDASRPEHKDPKKADDGEDYVTALTESGGVCITQGCGQPLAGDTLRCASHQADASRPAHKDPEKAKPRSPYQFETLKSVVCPPSVELLRHEKWLDRVPCNTKTGAIRKFTSAASSTFTKWRNGDHKARLPGFKSRKSRRQQFSVCSRAFGFKKRKAIAAPKARKRRKHERGKTRHHVLGAGRRKRTGARAVRPRGRRSRPWSLQIFPQLQSSDEMQLRSETERARADRAKHAMNRPMRTSRKDMVRLKRFKRKGKWCDSKVTKDECGHHYLELSIKVPVKELSPIWENQAYTDAFLDPGGRTFQTLYCPDGIAAKIGDDFYGLMLNKLRRADHIMGAADRRKKTEGPVRGYRRMLARAQALRTKVRNCVRNLHRKTARFLCSNFKAIHIPRFETGKIARVTELSRRISSGSVRGLMTFAHAEFFHFLEQYAIARGVHVIQVGESYTTKTCTFCGFQNDVGSRKTIKCASCGGKADRDHAGSRNIGIRTAMASE
jgi:transposase